MFSSVFLTGFSLASTFTSVSKSTRLKVSRKLTRTTTALGLLSGLLSLNISAHAAENLYEKNYIKQNNANLVSLEAKPDSKMYMSNHKEDDNVPMLENGYDLMGFSAFDAGDVPPADALNHAKAIHADTVLVYVKYGSEKIASSKIAALKAAGKKNSAGVTEISEKDLQANGTQYRYYASYWAKLPTPLLGVHIIKLKPAATGDDEEDAKVKPDNGLKLLAVIKGSPAATANLLRGDVLMKIGDITLEKPEALYEAVKKYQGQSVAIAYERNGEPAVTTATLNKR